MVKRHYSIADERYKLMHFYFYIDEWELYDLEGNPEEMNNVYYEPAYAEIRNDLHQRLEQLREKYGDSDELMKSMLPESEEEVQRNIDRYADPNWPGRVE